MYNLSSLILGKAPEFPRDLIWLNTEVPLSLARLRGYIVVIDFWTYCCINCIHMVPVFEKLSQEYKNSPVVFVGIHSAKFLEEQKPENIEEAIGRYEITHPVAVDDNMRLWNMYGASAWPTTVVIDPKGNIIYRSAGEKSMIEIGGVIEMLLEKFKADKELAKKLFELRLPERKQTGVLSYPGKMSFNADGSKFAVSDSNHNRILIVDASTGIVSDRIGRGERGLRDGSLTDAMFYHPQGVLWKDDTVYVADTENHAVRAIDLKMQRVETIAGNGEQGRYKPFEYSGAGKGTQLSSPWDLAFYDNKLLIAMAGFHQIWALEPKSGFVYPLAGDGVENIYDGNFPTAEFAQPSGLYADGDYVYVADSEVSGVRSIDMRQRFASTIVGTGLFEFGLKDGSLYDARLQHPLGVCASGNNVYVADTYNSSIRMIDLKKQMITTLVGTPTAKSMCKFGDPNCDTLGLYEPSDVKLRDNKLYIVDTNNHLIRTFDLKTMVLGTLKLTL